MANKEEMCTYSDIHGFLPGDPWRGHLGSQLDKDVDSKMSGKNKLEEYVMTVAVYITACRLTK